MPDYRTLHLIGIPNPHLGLANLADSRLYLATMPDSCLDLAPNMVTKPKIFRHNIVVRPKNLGVT